MGKLKSEELALQIVVNGDAARKQIADMSRAIKDLSVANQKLRAEQNALAMAGQRGTERYKELSKQIDVNRSIIKNNKAEIDKMRASISLNCMTMDDLSKKATSLRMALRYTVPGTRDWDEYAHQLKEVIARQVELKKASSDISSPMDSLAGKANQYFGAIAMGVQVYEKVSRKIEEFNQHYLEYDEALTSASRTTNLSKDAVEALSDELKSMDTRTSQNELIGLMEVAGKLGLSAEEDILGFVSAADKINVALSSDLGGNAEDALKSIGKLVDIFKLKGEYGMEESMLKVGSAINSLGMASTANEGYIVDFAQQMAGIAPTANMSIQQVLGLAATLDSLGQRGETATTALTNVIGDMFKKTEQYAKAAGVGVQDFQQLLENDVNEALLLVLEGVGNGSSADTIKALDSLGLSGSRATTILGSLSQNVDTIRYQQELANRAFSEGSSVIEEFERMNNSATAAMEKAKKAVTDQMVAIGKQLNPSAQASISISAQFLKMISSIIGLSIKYRAVLTGLTVAYSANIAMKKAGIVISKLQEFWTKRNMVALRKKAREIEIARLANLKLSASTTLLCGVQNLLVGNLKAAAMAFRGFFAAMSPIGWASLAIGALAGIISALRNKSREILDLSKEAAQITDQEGNSLVGKAEKMRRLMSVIEDTNIAEQKRNAAIKELQGLIPDGINLINQETIANGKAAAAVKQHTQALIAEATVKAALKKKEEILDKVGADKLAGKDRKVGFLQQMAVYSMAADSGGRVDPEEMINSLKEENARKYNENVDKQLAKLDDIIEKNSIGLPQIVVGNSATTPESIDSYSNDGNGGGYSQKWSLNSDEQFLQARLALKKKYQDSETMTQDEHNEELLKLEIDTLRARLATNKDSGADRVALEENLADKLIQQKERRKRQEEKDAKDAERKAKEATKAKEDEARKQDKINQDIAEMSGDRIAIEKAKYEKLKREYAGNTRALEALEKAHKARLAKIQLEAADKEIDARRDAYEIARVQMLNRHRQEMDAFSGSERERREKRKEHWAELNALDKEYLNETISDLSNLVDNAQVGDIEIGAELSDADKAKLLKEIEDLREQLAKLEGTSADTESKSGGGELWGLSQDQWKDMFSGNLEGWENWATSVASVVGGMGDQVISIWGKVDSFMAAKEKAQLKEYEKSNNKKKTVLEKRLNAGLMTEAQYNAEVEAMDAEYEAYQEELALKQAKRQKAMNLTQAIINTAVSVTQTLAQWGLPWGLIPAGLAAAMGAAEIALIASQPITTGAEEGGPIGVRRAQDGKRFNAKLSPDKRGFVSSPTVLVAENGLEYVVPNEAMQNPTVMPAIGAIESARKAGKLQNLDLSAVYSPNRITGRNDGGYIGTGVNSTSYSATAAPVYSVDLEPLLERVLSRLNEPIEAYVTMLGKNGLVENFEKYNKQKNRGKLG